MSHRHRIVRASAGTGKTYDLTTRYLWLMRRGALPSGVLATTFTRKAAGEILQRIVHRLAKAATKNDEVRQLAADLGDPALARSDAMEMLESLCGSLHRVSVSTIDSFFGRMAGGFRLELGLPAEVTLAGEDAPDVQRLRREAIDALLGGDEPQTLVDLMRRLHHNEQKRSVTESLDDIVRGVYSVWREAPDESAWSALDVPKALSETQLAEVVTQLSDLLGRGDVVSGKNPVKMVGKLRDAAMARRWEDILGGGKLVDSVIDGSNTYERKPIHPELVAVIQSLVTQCRAALLGGIASRTMAMRELAARFDAEYDRLRRERRVYLYSDLTHLLANELPRLGDEVMMAMYYRLDGRVRHLLLDEFQDTSIEQWKVLSPIVEEIQSHATEEETPARSVYCVGDTKQAIYGWRGGCAELFDAVEAMLPPEETDLAGKHESRRSSPVVLAAVNTVFASLGTSAGISDDDVRAEASEWARAFRTHTAAGDAAKAPGYVELITSAPPPKKKGHRDDDDDAEENGDEGADLTGGPEEHERVVIDLVKRIADASPGRTIGVLVSTNKAAHRYIPFLREAGVSVSGEGGNPLTDDAAVGVVLSALTLADHPGDTAARFHVENSPLGEALARLYGDGAKGRAGPAENAELIASRVRAALAAEGFAATIAAWAKAIAPSCGRRSVVRLSQLIELADTWDARRGLRATEFVREVESAAVEEASGDRVRVMTIHAAKGLEFDAVVLPELTRILGKVSAKSLMVSRPSPTEPIDGVYANTNEVTRALSEQLEDAYAQEHRRRLRDDLCALYVAMTRAKHALHMVIPGVGRNKDGALGKRGVTNGSLAAMLRAALSDRAPDAESLEGGDVLHRSGDPAWARRAKPQAAAGDEGERGVGSDELRVLRVAMRSPAEHRRYRPMVAPSSLEGAGLVSAKDLLATEKPEGKRRGVVIHRWFEMIDYLDAPGTPGTPRPAPGNARAEAWLDDAALFAAAREVDAEAKDAWLREQVARFRAMLERPAVREALAAARAGDGERDELWRERAFIVAMGERVVRGQFDRVVVRYRGDRPIAATLTDFKTDSLPPANPDASSGATGDAASAGVEALVAHYRPQMTAYRDALAAMLGIDRVKVAVRLLFVTPGVMREVE